ncbi:hypothetical protein A6V39_05060 [Candidatus Mycoplasma haematobovis]|uniref:Uncharacterized protein n=1 Tax=Candidatus Mycoplasma haematobovis TaxID=432608 RepID=A0A1A9QBG0_9MOLU|nr:hypothetical protein [Candidatus Mycoplasma haematobovis]OAL09797.1 hypothetical protein A6V39_05060 [Candidatus Mycoplasma haematobovis]
MSSSLITNLSLSGIGLTTIGGIIGGGYYLLKDDPRPITKFLDVKKRTLLSLTDSSDDIHWKTNWGKYIDRFNPPPKPKPLKPKDSQAPTEPDPVPESIKDVWSLSDWDQKKGDKEKVPQTFKDACSTKSKENVPGIWSAKFKEVEEYCTKATPEDL